MLVLAAGSLLDRDAVAVLDAAAQAGFDGVGLRWSAEHRGTSPATIAARARELGISIHDTEVYRIGTDAADPQPLLEASAELGASAVLVVSDLDHVDQTMAAVADLVEASRPFGLQVGLEYMAWTTPASAIDAVTIAEQTDCVIVVDVLHHCRIGAGLAELDAVVDSGRLGWIQLCDAPGAAPGDLVHEARHARLAPGAGSLPLRALLAVVPDDTVVSVEVQSDALAVIPAEDRARLLYDAARTVLVR